MNTVLVILINLHYSGARQTHGPSVLYFCVDDPLTFAEDFFEYILYFISFFEKTLFYAG